MKQLFRMSWKEALHNAHNSKLVLPKKLLKKKIQVNIPNGKDINTDDGDVNEYIEPKGEDVER